MRRNNGDRVDALLPLYWRSAFGDQDDDRDRPLLRPHRAGRAQLRRRAAVLLRAQSGAEPSRSSRRCCRSGATSTTARTSGSWTLALLPQARPRHQPDHGVSAVLVVQARRPGDRGRLPALLARRRREREPVVDLRRAAGLLVDGRAPGARAGSSPPGTRATRASGYASHAFLPLFYQASGPDHFALLTLLGGYRRSGPSRLWYATPLVWSQRQRPTSSFSMAFPLWFRHTDKMAETTTTVVPPLLYVSRTTPDGALPDHARRSTGTTATSRRRPGWCCRCSTTSTNTRLSRTTAVFPLFVRHHIAAEERPTGSRRSSTATPARATPPRSAFPLVFLPLYWDIRRGEIARRWCCRCTQLAAAELPVDAGGSVLLPPGRPAPDGTPDGTYHRFVGVVLPVYESAVKRPGDFMWRLLRGLVGGERIGHHRYLRLFWFFDVEPEPARETQTAWYSKPVPHAAQDGRTRPGRRRVLTPPPRARATLARARGRASRFQSSASSACVARPAAPGQGAAPSRAYRESRRTATGIGTRQRAARQPRYRSTTSPRAAAWSTRSPGSAFEVVELRSPAVLVEDQLPAPVAQADPAPALLGREARELRLRVEQRLAFVLERHTQPGQRQRRGRHIEQARQRRQPARPAGPRPARRRRTGRARSPRRGRARARCWRGARGTPRRDRRTRRTRPDRRASARAAPRAAGRTRRRPRARRWRARRRRVASGNGRGRHAGRAVRMVPRDRHEHGEEPLAGGQLNRRTPAARPRSRDRRRRSWNDAGCRCCPRRAAPGNLAAPPPRACRDRRTSRSETARSGSRRAPSRRRPTRRRCGRPRSRRPRCRAAARASRAPRTSP